MQPLSLEGKAEFLRDFVFQLLDLFALEFDDPAAISADNVAVMGVLGIVRIVKLVIFSKVHFPHQAALG